MGQRRFTWRDGERLIRFRPGLTAVAHEELAARGWGRFEILSTARALRGAPAELAERADEVHEVPSGSVPEASAALIDAVAARTLVALGGGRVIDSAKAIAAVRGGRVAALPTTLSGAEMTTIHRLPAGQQAASRVRPALVLADPEPMTGLAEDRLRASAMNALAHGTEALCTPGANPVATLAALRGAELIAAALDQPRPERDRAALALGSLLCAYALDSAGLALHHVVCQSLVRSLAIPHAETNATMLPHTTEALRERAPEEIGALAEALGVAAEELGGRIETLGGGPRRLADLGVDRSRIEAAVEAMLGRPDLEMTPGPPPGREELLALVEAAW